jgi:DNA invertase Pin-like site-specific DNA recombinase
MSGRKPPLDEKALAFFRRTGRIGGRRSLETMTAAERKARAKHAGLAGGRPPVVDREKVIALRAAGKTLEEIATVLHCSRSTVSRIAAGKRQKKGGSRRKP